MNKTIHVLLIEDNLEVIRLIEEFLKEDKEFNFIIKSHDKLSEGIKDLKSKKKDDIILVDLFLPDSKGRKTIQSILEATSSIPIIILTGLDDQQLAIDSLEMGVQDYLIKENLNSSTLIRAIRYAVERMQLTKTISSLKNNYESFLTNSQDIIARFDSNFNHLYVNPAIERATGLPSSDFIGKTNEELGMPEAQVAFWNKKLKVTFETGKPQKFDFNFPSPDGTQYFQSILNPEFLEGSIKSVIGITRNITEIKEVEQELKNLTKELKKKVEEKTRELKESEEMFRNIAEQSSIGIGIIQDNKYKYLNNIYAETFGYTVEEMMNWETSDAILVIHPEDRKFALEQLAKKQKGDKDIVVNYQFRGIKKSGEIIWIEQFSKPIIYNGRISLLSSIINITERKKVSEESRLQGEIMKNLAEGIYLIRISDLEILWANDRFEEMFGYEPGEMIGKPVMIVNAPTDKTPEETAEEIVGVLQKTGEWHGEVNNIKKDGTPFWCHANVSIFNHPEYGEVLMSVHTDITERKMAEEKDKRKTIIMKAINEIFQSALTCETEEELGKICLEVAQKLSGAKFGFFGEVNKEDKFDTLAISNPGWNKCTMPESTATKVIRGMEIRGMQFLPLKDGKSRIFNDPSNHPDSVGIPGGHPKLTSLLAVPFKYKGKIIGQIGLGNKKGGFEHHDLEAIESLSIAMIEALLRKRAEERLKVSEEKYREAYEQADFYKDLFAHDMNNVLNNIKGSADLFSMYEKNPEKMQERNEMIDIMKDQTTKGINLISNVRKLSKLEEEDKITLEKIDTNKFIKEAVEFTQNSFQGRDLDINFEFLENHLDVHANNLILDVIINILNNAVKYNDTTTVKVRIKGFKVQQDGKSHVRLEFMDNGIGISDELKMRVFKKGYQKEKRSKGMGFGLTLVKKIIESYEGQIWIENRVKGDYTKGSNFIILIPSF